MRDVRTLVPFPKNPNQHPAEQITMLAKIVCHTGWRHSIVVSTRSGFVTKGHGRMEAAKLIGQHTGFWDVPVELQDYDTEAEEWADIVADNRIAELSELNPGLVAELAIGIEAEMGDSFLPDLLGYTEDAYAELFPEPEPESADDTHFTAQELENFTEYLTRVRQGAAPTVNAVLGQTWRINGVHYFHVGSMLYGHADWMPLTGSLAAEFPDRRTVFVALPDPLMVATTSRAVACLFLQTDVYAAKHTLSFLQDVMEATIELVSGPTDSEA